METLQFEAIKIALKQDKSGYVLTLNVHPDEVPDQLLRDFVGARYQVVMVRINGNDEPMDRQEEFEGSKAMGTAGMLCRDPLFWQFVAEQSLADPNEAEATEWLRQETGINSRTELKSNANARIKLAQIHKEFIRWKEN